ncbi:unnamed protein product [Phytophthora fragariaefolia]|uniref:Unnamed protein product n=1 Tax=Phytophthora fragariaefolia TaxID=1490495 RepID=A0A9W6UFN3_9STRA|nr:unnamed protein product [Phytophthora fragariaefolia]
MTHEWDARGRNWLKILGSGSDIVKAPRHGGVPPERGLSRVGVITHCPAADSFDGRYCWQRAEAMEEDLVHSVQLIKSVPTLGHPR